MSSLKLFKYLLVALFLVPVLTSCNKDLMDEDESETSNVVSGNSEDEGTENGALSGGDDCFTFNYPVDVILPDGTTTSADSDSVLYELFEMYDDDASGEEPMLVYPINVNLQDGTTQDLQSDEELYALEESCEDDDDDYDEDDEDEHDCDYDEICFEIVYPIDISLPDGTVQTVESDSILEYYAEVFDDEDIIPVFPITIIDLEENQVTIETEEEFFALLESCEEEDDDDDDDEDEDFDLEDIFENECFSFIYPIDINLPDGSTSTLNSDEEMIAFVEALELEDYNENEYPMPVFPINILVEGEEVSIKDLEDFSDVLENCDD